MDADRIKDREELKHLLDKATGNLGIYEPDKQPAGVMKEPSIGDLRRSRRRMLDDSIGMMTLTEDDGVLRWEEGAGVIGLPGRRARRGTRVSGDIIAQYKFEKLEPSKVGSFLTNLDADMTPNQGMRRWERAAGVNAKPDDATLPLTSIGGTSAQKRILLLIHGTFSNSDNIIRQMLKTAEGRTLINSPEYDEVLAFDHPTLSVSPVLNALDLTRFFANCKAPIDVVCHSRGGLIARWWVEGFSARAIGERRILFVGSPLAGTSLAAPPRLRAGLDYLTNVGKALSKISELAALAVPFMSVAAGLFKVISSVTSFGANTPLIDAAVAMIPGLAGQSRVGNSPELLRLRTNNGNVPQDYFAVLSNFEPAAVGWAFWKKFVKWKSTLADLGADLVFDGENDLVVDTSSMTDLFDAINIPDTHIKNFGTTDQIHHTNYFQQADTIKFIGQSFRVVV